VANLPDNSGDALSNIVTGNGTRSLTFTMPKTVALDVESVVASLNNASAADVTPEITIKDASGEVIATTAQTTAIPAGDTGTATFARRLAASQAGGGSGIQFDTSPQSGDWLDITTTGVDANGFGLDIESTHDVEINSLASMELDATTLLLLASALVEIDAATFLVKSNNILLQGSAGSTAQILSRAISIFANGTTLNLQAQTDLTLLGSDSVKVTATSQDITLHIGTTTKSVIVTDHLNNQIFRVDENGDLHGKTGKSLVFDL
jgi:hypothetical protein